MDPKNLILLTTSRYQNNQYGATYLSNLKGKILTHRTWINSGILYIKDIVDENRTLNERTITEELRIIYTEKSNSKNFAH